MGFQSDNIHLDLPESPLPEAAAGSAAAKALSASSQRKKAYVLGGLHQGTRARKVLNEDMNRLQFAEPKGYHIAKPMEAHLAFEASKNDTMGLARSFGSKKAFTKASLK